MKPILNNKLYELPFDQFSRQYAVSRLINEIIRGVKTKNQKIKIIDLGGHKGQTRLFQPNDEVTILDVYNEKYEGYVKGDATRLDFKDNEFDISVSFDVFEHIPRPKRRSFIKEALRVSRLGAFIAMPVDNPTQSVSQSEVALNEFFKTLYGSDHQWLKEHIDYKIPSDDEVESQISNASADWVSFNSNNLEAWRLMQLAIFMAAKDPELSKPVIHLNTKYNMNFQLIDASPAQQSYRKIYFISQNNKLIKKAQTLKQKSSHQENIKQPIEVFKDVTTLVAKAVKKKNKKIKNLTANNTKLIIENHNLNNSVKELQSEITRVYSSRSWRYVRKIAKIKSTLKGK